MGYDMHLTIILTVIHRRHLKIKGLYIIHVKVACTTLWFSGDISKHATSQSQRLPEIVELYEGMGERNCVSLKPQYQGGANSRASAWQDGSVNTIPGPRPANFETLWSEVEQSTPGLRRLLKMNIDECRPTEKKNVVPIKLDTLKENWENRKFQAWQAIQYPPWLSPGTPMLGFKDRRPCCIQICHKRYRTILCIEARLWSSWHDVYNTVDLFWRRCVPRDSINMYTIK